MSGPVYGLDPGFTPACLYKCRYTCSVIAGAAPFVFNFTGILMAVKRRVMSPHSFHSVILIVCNFIINRLSLSLLFLTRAVRNLHVVAALLLQAYILAKRYNKAFDDPVSIRRN
jgi:hypothetical protein